MRRRAWWLVPLLLVLTIVACDLRALLGVVAAGSIPVGFAIVTVAPANRGIGVSAGASISVTFTAAVALETLTSTTFAVRDSLGQLVSGTYAGGINATFTPTTPLRNGERYTVELSTGVQDSAGRQLPNAVSLSFRTMQVITGGGWHAIVAQDDGSAAYAWGSNFGGSLGDGTTAAATSPVQVLAEGGTGTLSNIAGLAAGNEHSLALLKNGTVLAWGDNGSGQLGDGSTTDSSTPVQVVGVGGIGVLSGVVAIAAEYYQSLALLADGSVVAWGDGGYGVLGDGKGADSSSPVRVCAVGESDPCGAFLSGVIAISAGSFHSLALGDDGTVLAWGDSSYGELGNGITNSTQWVPAQVLGVGGSGGLSNIAAVDAGTYLSAALASDGSVYTFGGNYAGQLGNGGGGDSNTPVQVVGPGGSGVLSGVVALDAASDHVVALQADGTVWSWGENLFGELGDDSGHRQLVPGPGGRGGRVRYPHRHHYRGGHRLLHQLRLAQRWLTGGLGVEQ